MMEKDRENPTNRDAVEMRDEPLENQQQERVEEQVVENKATTDSPNEELAPLFEETDAGQFRTQWLNIQSKFVDNPRESVREADELVANVLKSVTMSFHERRTSLEKQWNGGGNASTEDLRLALKSYRSFFERLLTLES
jgi:hypothetical protein